ncbi:MAG: metallopeptidase TldD-related protein, partial [Myxococcota bacterium]
GSGWNALSTRLARELDFARVGRVAAEKALASAKPRALEPGRYTVVLEPAAAGELFEYLAGALDRRAVDEGRSCFVGKRSQQIINGRLSLTSDPRTTPMLPFDGEGLALAPRWWVKNGVLEELRVSRYWAQKQGLSPTGSYDGAEVSAGDASRAQLLAGVKRGVLITRIWYSNLVDPQTLLITGLTRDGTFLIEDGAIAAPVKNFRLNQSVLDALFNVDAVGAERESPGSSAWKVPALRTHDFLLASQSDAV